MLFQSRETQPQLPTGYSFCSNLLSHADVDQELHVTPLTTPLSPWQQTYYDFANIVMEDLIEEDELRRYRHRNFVPSHLLRMGMRLFSNQRQFPVRKRIIDAQFYGPPERLPHPNAPKPRYVARQPNYSTTS